MNEGKEKRNKWVGDLSLWLPSGVITEVTNHRKFQSKVPLLPGK